METADPDDAMTLAWLATHPRVNLRGVTITPGGNDQVRLVRTILRRLGRSWDVHVGAANIDDGKQRISGFHRRWIPDWDRPAEPDGTPVEVLRRTLKFWPDAVLLTGAPLRNAIDFFDEGGDFFRSWTCQGGFAGSNVVDDADQLPKFRGKEVCATWNLGGSPRAEVLFGSERVPHVKFVSKNVCHGLRFGPAALEWSLKQSPRHAGLALLLQGMQVYMDRKPEGKALHDVVAAVAMVHPEVATWSRGYPFKEKGQWGWEPMTDPEDGPAREITVKVDANRFMQGLVG